MFLPDSFIERCEQAQFDLGSHTIARIVQVAGPAFFRVDISEDGGQTFAPMTNDGETVFFTDFSAALQALIELVQEW